VTAESGEKQPRKVGETGEKQNLELLFSRLG